MTPILPTNVNQFPSDNHKVILIKDYDASNSDAELQGNAATQRVELNQKPAQMICEASNPYIMEVDSQPVESKPSDAELNVEPSNIETRFETIGTENNSTNNLPAGNPASSNPCLNDQLLREASTPFIEFDHNRLQSTISSPSIRHQLLDNCITVAPQAKASRVYTIQMDNQSDQLEPGDTVTNVEANFSETEVQLPGNSQLPYADDMVIHLQDTGLQIDAASRNNQDQPNSQSERVN